MENSFVIRVLDEDDASAYKALRLRALKETPQAFISTFEVETKKPLSGFVYELSYAQQSPIWGYYGIFIDQKLVGFCQISKVYAVKKTHIANLYNLYVDPHHRGQGLAKKLVTKVLEKAKSQNIERVFINYLSKNKSARGFYDHLGFKQCGVRPKAAKDGDEYDDEVEMVLEV